MTETFGVVFDIDGVLMKDGVVIPRAAEALSLLHDQATGQPIVPYVFVTNNGGFTEREKADKISSVLGFKIEEDRVMVAHTPMRPLAERYADGNVLIVARNHQTALNLAKWYGFKNCTSIYEYVEKRPYLNPGRRCTFWTTGVQTDYKIDEPQEKEQLPFKAIIFFENPEDWGESIQVMSDILQSKDGLISMNHIDRSETQVIDLHVANPDFSYGGEFVLPRYTTGALITCLSTLFKIETGNDLKVTFYGKPEATTYQYAKVLMDAQLKKLNLAAPKHIYAIGDNPQSDIMGANRLEHEGWVSILVRTGVFKGDNDAKNPAKHVVDNVYEAIQLIRKQH
ncbi:hypothetical protein SAMD00019534_070280, partial [Acytostelium subglobosum LB1]|uniref:hypothetical protein n=1 Tax=Acytostelium subglobosum LB1 TaxID=1410327 RepID=UPI00064498B4